MGTMLWPFLTFIGLLLAQGLAYDSGYWTPTPTTTSYWSYWTPSTTYVTCYTQENVIVTVTSVLPCPVTSTVVYWECCDQCENNCYNTPTGWVGTTTVTSYTTTTPTAQAVQTITSNGLVIVMVDSTAASQSATPSVVYEVSSEAGPLQEGALSSFWPMGILLAAIATIMIML
ncbi:uncharacterized protein PV07_03932 [Cladophialophora immunda]|uniref:Uncharacterized protein n=1 Tax=Cladophialophora immunda TaxID=569365 RepID=A0A0D2CQV6_9EURO|nr:uncharacterized protein PV07_03932 [Cladophialophora immunda]KIW32380.1 hypothetical protein PV07_03932 [Cladophialophora immunda]